MIGELLLSIIPGTLPQVVLLYSRKDLEHVSLPNSNMALGQLYLTVHARYTSPIILPV